jgi:hypothetical protein
MGASSSFGGKGQAEAFTVRELGAISNQIRTNEHAEVRVTGVGCLLLVGRRFSGVPRVVAGSQSVIGFGSLLRLFFVLGSGGDPRAGRSGVGSKVVGRC